MAKNNVKSRTDWGRLSRLTDKEIHKAVAGDPNAAPIVSAEWFRGANLLEPQTKKAVSIRLDEDVLQWFKRRGRGYQTRINAVLRAYVESHR
ncbi:MAG: BrnA antitoxin family protein [Acidobacteria bacterium]|nr:BrnA antitoxin family protein [Acidobacteriota bacterium]